MIRPAISIILPAYNVADYIGKAITSIRNQRFTDFEVLCIDDGSTDSTQENAIAAIANDTRFQLIAQANAGLSAARNAGLDLATGDVVAFLDGDDSYDPDFLATLHCELMSTDADWVSCAIAFCTARGDRHLHSAIHARPVPDDPPLPRDYDLATWPDVIAHFPSAWNKLYRRNFIGDLRFDEGTWYEDHTFFHRLAARSSRLRHVPRPLYNYTLEREGQITRADSDRIFEQISVLDSCATLMRASAKPGGATGLARLATRLCNERLDVIASAERRARFLAEASAFFVRNGLAPDWTWDPYLDPLTSFALSGQPPVTIRVSAQTPDLASQLANLPIDLQGCFAVACWSDRVPDGALVLDLPPCSGPLNLLALSRLATTLLRGTASAAVVPLTRTDTAKTLDATPEGGGRTNDPPRRLYPETAISLQPDCHALLTHTDQAGTLSGLDPGLRLTQQALRLVETQGLVIFSDDPLTSTPPAASVPLRQRLIGIQTLSRHFSSLDLPAGWDRRLWLRNASIIIARWQRDPNRVRRRARALLPLLYMGWVGHSQGWIGRPGVVDETTPRVLRRLFRLLPKQ